MQYYIFNVWSGIQKHSSNDIKDCLQFLKKLDADGLSTDDLVIFTEQEAKKEKFI